MKGLPAPIADIKSNLYEVFAINYDCKQADAWIKKLSVLHIPVRHNGNVTVLKGPKGWYCSAFPDKNGLAYAGGCQSGGGGGCVASNNYGQVYSKGQGCKLTGGKEAFGWNWNVANRRVVFGHDAEGRRPPLPRLRLGHEPDLPLPQRQVPAAGAEHERHRLPRRLHVGAVRGLEGDGDQGVERRQLQRHERREDPLRRPREAAELPLHRRRRHRHGHVHRLAHDEEVGLPVRRRAVAVQDHEDDAGPVPHPRHPRRSTEARRRLAGSRRSSRPARSRAASPRPLRPRRIQFSTAWKQYVVSGTRPAKGLPAAVTPGSPATLIWRHEVAGYLKLTFGAVAPGTEVRIAFSETAEYLGVEGTSDWSRTYLTDDVEPTSGETWVDRPGCSAPGICADGYRAFRFARVYVERGSASILEADVVPVLADPPPQGWFLSSDDQLNRIWYSSAYTAQLMQLPADPALLGAGCAVPSGETRSSSTAPSATAARGSAIWPSRGSRCSWPTARPARRRSRTR